MSHVRILAQEPHPIGSAENAKVRSYLIEELNAQGINPEVQETRLSSLQNSRSIIAATGRNVIGRLKGQSNTRAVMLCAHYDSVAHGPGASDDGAGVATLLETLRALKSGPPLKNDVIFLFTDGEEAGLLGARAFVEGHPWAKDSGVVLNFEARGTSGPVFMFETSRHNGWLIERFSAAARHPIAGSYMYDLYKQLPNNTDLSVFKSAGLAGLNFAFIDGSANYHTPGDNINNIDERSLQHAGLYALALTREFGDLDLDNTDRGDAVYFDLLGLRMVHYPARLVIPLAAFIVLLFLGVVAMGVRKGRLVLRGMGLGFLALLSSTVCAALTARLAWLISGSPSSRTNAGSHSRDFLLLGFAALTIAVVFVVYRWFVRRVSLQDLAIGGLLYWLILVLLTAVYLPGASYLFAWPLLFSLLPFGLLFASTSRGADSPGFFGLLSLSSIPGVILILPVIYTLSLSIGLRLPEALMMLLTLLIGPLIPYLSLLTVKRKT